jgi:hypothetical protein
VLYSQFFIQTLPSHRLQTHQYLQSFAKPKKRLAKKTKKNKSKRLIVATARGRRRMRGSVVGLGLLGLLTGAAAFSVSPALRPASTRASVNVKGL